MKIKVKILGNNIVFPKIIKVGDWIDLRASETIHLKAPQSGTLRNKSVNGEVYKARDVNFFNTLIPLGVAIKVPKGYESILAVRSSTFNNYKIIQSNSIGIIDNTYSSDKDEWKLPVIALADTTIPEGARICQFRVQLSQKATMWQKLKWLFTSRIKIVEVSKLGGKERGGFGKGTENIK